MPAPSEALSYNVLVARITTDLRHALTLPLDEESTFHHDYMDTLEQLARVSPNPDAAYAVLSKLADLIYELLVEVDESTAC